MKKLIVVVALIAFAASMSACKTHEKCPAYGNAGKVSHYKKA